jgi:hypothetical protein
MSATAQKGKTAGRKAAPKRQRTTSAPKVGRKKTSTPRKRSETPAQMRKRVLGEAHHSAEEAQVFAGRFKRAVELAQYCGEFMIQHTIAPNKRAVLNQGLCEIEPSPEPIAAKATPSCKYIVEGNKAGYDVGGVDRFVACDCRDLAEMMWIVFPKLVKRFLTQDKADASRHMEEWHYQGTTGDDGKPKPPTPDRFVVMDATKARFRELATVFEAEFGNWDWSPARQAPTVNRMGSETGRVHKGGHTVAFHTEEKHQITRKSGKGGTRTEERQLRVNIGRSDFRALLDKHATLTLELDEKFYKSKDFDIPKGKKVLLTIRCKLVDKVPSATEPTIPKDKPSTDTTTPKSA